MDTVLALLLVIVSPTAPAVVDLAVALNAPPAVETPQVVLARVPTGDKWLDYEWSR
jgi:hypothetical protein